MKAFIYLRIAVLALSVELPAFPEEPPVPAIPETADVYLEKKPDGPTASPAPPELSESLKKAGEYMVRVAAVFKQCDTKLSKSGREFDQERSRYIPEVEKRLYPEGSPVQDAAKMTEACRYIIEKVMDKTYDGQRCANCGERSWFAVCAVFASGLRSQICRRRPPGDHQFVLAVEGANVYLVDGYGSDVPSNIKGPLTIGKNKNGGFELRDRKGVIEGDVECLGPADSALFPAPGDSGPGFELPKL